MGIHLSLKIRILLSLVLLFACFPTVSQYALATAFSRAQENKVRPQPIASPTPQRSPSPLSALEPRKISTLRKVYNFLNCHPAKKTKEQELSRRGPQFPVKYDASDFSIVALTKGDWTVAFEYELQPQSNLTITFQVKGVAPFSQTASTSNLSAALPNSQAEGIPGLLVFRLPKRPGEIGPQATLISFQALTDNSSGKAPAYFRLNAFGLGDRALVASFNRPRPQTIATNEPQMKVSYPSFLQAGYSPDSSLPNTSSGGALTAVNIEPGKVSAKTGGIVNYNFISTNDFGSWRADYFQDKKNPSGSHSLQLRGTDKFYKQPVRAGLNPQPPPVPSFNKWTIKPKKMTRGQYKIQVSAWWNVNIQQIGGESAARDSSSFVNID